MHDRGASNIAINKAFVTFELEMRDAAQSRTLRETFEAEGYALVRQ
jgi:hypothetical protein